MSYLMGSEQQRQRLGVEAAKIKGKLSLDTVIVAWENLLENVTKAHRLRKRRRTWYASEARH
jgi:hypothetical protein